MDISMSFIALFLPACISVVIRHKRNKELTWKMPECIFEYAILVVINTFLAEAVITYGLRIDGVDITAFESFGFFTKYLFISSVIAFFIPYIEEIYRKYVSISFSVEKKEEEKGR